MKCQLCNKESCVIKIHKEKGFLCPECYKVCYDTTKQEKVQPRVPKST